MSPESRDCVDTFRVVPYAAVINVSESHRKRRAGIREHDCVDLTNEVILIPVNTPASFDAGKVEFVFSLADMCVLPFETLFKGECASAASEARGHRSKASISAGRWAFQQE